MRRLLPATASRASRPGTRPDPTGCGDPGEPDPGSDAGGAATNAAIKRADNQGQRRRKGITAPLTHADRRRDPLPSPGPGSHRPGPRLRWDAFGARRREQTHCETASAATNAGMLRNHVAANRCSRRREEADAERRHVSLLLDPRHHDISQLIGACPKLGEYVIEAVAREQINLADAGNL